MAGGCASSASLSSWQRNVETYVAEKGDPSALRDVTIDGQRHGFAVIGQPVAEKSTDANGLLLGHQEIAGRAWFIYLVGIVHQQKVGDIHLAAVTFTNGKPQWQVSKNDAKAAEMYRNYNEGLWKQHHPGSKEKTPAEYTTFPRDADKFDLEVKGDHIAATHAPSGAQWVLDRVNVR
jgi:hypothetical protein